MFLLVYRDLRNNGDVCGDLVPVGNIDFWICPTVDLTSIYDYQGTSLKAWDNPLGTACPTAAPTPSPDPSVDKDNRNGIMRAAVSGDTTSLAVALADPRQNIDHMDSTKFGYNALMLAAQHDHQDVVRMLLDAGADTGLLTSTDVEEENNWSNVMVAAWYGDEEVRASRGVREKHTRVTDRPTPQAHTLRRVPRPCACRKRVSSSSAEWWAVGTRVARL